MIDRLRGFLAGLKSLAGFRIYDSAHAMVAKNLQAALFLLIRYVLNGFRIYGTFKVDFINDQGVHYKTGVAPNSVVNQGLNYILNVALGGATQITSWYVMLVDNTSFTAFAAADTHASHAGWIEMTAYSQATRVAWTAGTSTSQSISNTASANFSINASKTIRGLAMTNDPTKGGTGGGSSIIFSEAGFSGGNQSANSGDTLQVTYTVNASST